MNPRRVSVFAAMACLVSVAGLRSSNANTDGEADRAAPAPLVVGGSPVPEGKWEDAAAIYVDTGEIVCSGVLVAPDVVLTAGHCAHGDISHVKLAANSLADPGEVISVTREIPYPNSWQTYDIAVLLLASESSVEPRTITTGCIRDFYLANGAPVAIVGYGATDVNGTVYPSVLMEGFTTINDYNCTLSTDCRTAAQPDGELGAGGAGVDSCVGDSGGPLYLLTERGDYLVGTTSRGYPSNTVLCSQGGIYVRPDKIIDWIETQSGRELPRAVCNLEPAPTADPLTLEVEAGDTADTAISANDPDPEDSHVFSVGVEPEHGSVTVDAEGVARFTADSSYEGEDSFVIAVTDNGQPNLTGTVEIQVTVLPGAGCGCRSNGDGGGSALLGVLVALTLLVRRRTPRPRFGR